MTLPHFIGPKMPHKYDPAVLKQVQAKIDEALSKGRNLQPQQIHLQTRTLRYNQHAWLSVLGLQEHWQDSRVDAVLQGNALKLTTRNITALQQTASKQLSSLEIDGVKLPPKTTQLIKVNGSWKAGASEGLQKRPGLQGPMDDVLLTPFLVVMPSKPSQHPAVERWTQYEMARFAKQWRELFRGTLRVKKDTEVTAEDVKQYSLICWGDPTSNVIIQKVHQKFPLRWDEQGNVSNGQQTFPGATTIPALIYPNPANPERYLVLNNGCSFREGHCTTNALQNPKLGDYAIFDLSKDPDGLAAGKVLQSGFFNEQWGWKAPVQ
jgi:hypothetical protein